MVIPGFYRYGNNGSVVFKFSNGNYIMIKPSTGTSISEGSFRNSGDNFTIPIQDTVEYTSILINYTSILPPAELNETYSFTNAAKITITNTVVRTYNAIFNMVNVDFIVLNGNIVTITTKLSTITTWMSPEHFEEVVQLYIKTRSGRTLP